MLRIPGIKKGTTQAALRSAARNCAHCTDSACGTSSVRVSRQNRLCGEPYRLIHKEVCSCILHCLETTFLKYNMPAYPDRPSGTGIRDITVPRSVQLYSEALLSYQAGFLTHRSSLLFPFSQIAGMQWDPEESLPVYSDRIAQASHLIPSSEPADSALDTAI